jgi:RimJ/RimL family protein N-acetyltransferase
MSRVARVFAEEFKLEAVRLHERSGRSLSQTAADLGISYWTLRNWCKDRDVVRRSKKAPPTKAAAAALLGETLEEKVARLERETIEGRDEVEIGYDLAKEHWGQGIASEAALAAFAHCFDVLRLPRVISLIAPENAASQGVARRLGMRHERDVTWRGGRFGMYAVERAVS